MIKIKPQNPKGVRDYLPEENQKREYIINAIKKYYELYGFQSIYTPAFERLETLQGKYGDEGDKLLFKILNSGEYLTESAVENINSGEIKYGKLTQEISSKGLRYDHTVPLARFVSQHQNDLSFPFKRYQIAPVWRADRPQKGRYQEFFQCDADIVGTKGLIADVELINLIQDVFDFLDLKVEIKINNRKIYNGICSEIGIEDKSILVSTILDKWDKIGDEKVKEELTNLIGGDKAYTLLSYFNGQNYTEVKGNNHQIIEGQNELDYIFKHTSTSSLKFDLKLLRGLDYYTGTVLEVVSTETQMGSLLGGGRYDNLTEMFGLKDISGIGISFGLDRIYDVMTELGKFPDFSENKKILILNLSDKAESQYYILLNILRKQNIVIDLYPQFAKMDKQLNYADKCKYSHAIIIGEEEVAENIMQLKNLKLRKQESFDNIKELISSL